MKYTLKLPEIEKVFHLKPTEVNLVTIEHKELLYRTINSIKDAIELGESECSFFADSKATKLSENAIILTNLFDWDVESKKTQNRLLKYVERNFQGEECTKQLDKINDIIRIFVESQVFKCDIPVVSSFEITISDILKYSNIALSSSPTNLLERIVDYIKFSNKLFSVNIVFIYGLHQFLSKNDILLLLKELEYMQIIVFLIENCEIAQYFESIMHLIVDNDLCEITK